MDRQIARGGAARVFLAYDRSGTPVALKVLHPELTVSVTADRFLREIQFLSRIDHPRIARFLSYGEADWLVYYVMTYVEGPTLREVLDHQRKLSIADTQKLAADMLDALSYAHGMGIVHRDVKPENMVVASSGPVLMDFGIARAIMSSGQDRLTRSGFAVGTTAYMSPEQVAGAEDIDHRSDVYSLGCVLFECLAGRPPFTAPRDELILTMHRQERPPNVKKLRTDTPDTLVNAIDRSLEKKAADRWASAAEMQSAILGD